MFNDQPYANAVLGYSARKEATITIYDLFSAGWTVEPASLYDEEGVEGWRWFTPDYEEHSTVIGLWSETPPLPDPLPVLNDREEVER